jgi:hypothetical protein
MGDRLYHPSDSRIGTTFGECLRPGPKPLPLATPLLLPSLLAYKSLCAIASAISQRQEPLSEVVSAHLSSLQPIWSTPSQPTSRIARLCILQRTDSIKRAGVTYRCWPRLGTLQADLLTVI